MRRQMIRGGENDREVNEGLQPPPPPSPSNISAGTATEVLFPPAIDSREYRVLVELFAG